MKNFSSSPLELVRSFWVNQSLIYELSKREVMGRYRGSLLGIFWSFFNPMLMLAVYTIVFSEIFKARWNIQGDSKVEYAMILFSGLIIFNIFSECLSQAPRLIVGNTNYVKKVVFPLEIMCWVNLYSALFHGAISLFVWLAAYAIYFGAPNLSILLLPLILFPFCMMVMGFAWILASLGVYLRDVSQIIGIFLTAFMFLSPIFYSITSVPLQYQSIILFNPITVPIQFTRDFLYWGIFPESNIPMLIYYYLAAFFVACFGFFWFQKTRKGFADVL